MITSLQPDFNAPNPRSYGAFLSVYYAMDLKTILLMIIARPSHEPPAILSCTPGLAGYPFDPTQLWHG